MEDRLHWSVHLVADDLHGTFPESLRVFLAPESLQNRVTVIDNAPAGDTRPELARPDIHWLRNPRPKSFGASQNQALGLALAHVSGEASRHVALILSSDVVVPDDLMSRLSGAFQSNPSLAAVGPKMQLAHITGSLDGEHHDIEFTETSDQAGFGRGWFGGAKNPYGVSPFCFAVRLSAMRALSAVGPWFEEEGDWIRASLGAFRRLQASGFTVTDAPYARAWRLAARP